MPFPVGDGGGGSREAAPEGTYRCVCVGIYDLGNQPRDGKGPARKVVFHFELDAKDPEGRALAVNREFFTFFSPDSYLRQFLESWRGRPFDAQEAASFDLLTVLGKPGVAEVTQNTSAKGKTYGNIESIRPLAKGMVALAPTLPVIAYVIDDDGKSIPPSVPKYIADKIRLSLEFAGPAPKQAPPPGSTPAPAGGYGRRPAPPDDDDIPF